MKRDRLFRIPFLVAVIALCLSLVACGRDYESDEAVKSAISDVVENGQYIKKSDMSPNPYENLCVPTQLAKIGDDYFIVDCYHNQILTSVDVSAPLNQWKTIWDELSMGHSIAGDGVVYLADDTENARVLVFVKQGEDFYLTQTFDDVGIRTHFVHYDEKRKLFYVLSSLTGEIYTYKRVKDSCDVELEAVHKLQELDGIYIRSFSIIDNKLYLPAGDGNIYIVNPKTFKIMDVKALAPELGGPTQISRIGDYYYLTVSTDIFGFSTAANIVRAKSLDSFFDSTYESVRSSFCMDGTPYVITQIDDGYYLALHSDFGPNCMWYFEADDVGEISNVCQVFDSTY